MNTVKSIEKYKIIAIARNIAVENIVKIASALYNGGIKILEVTFEQNNPDTLKETSEKISILSNEFKDKMIIGAGTVLTSKQVDVSINAGAKYIVSPNFDRKVVESTLKKGIVSIPGAFTPTEILEAYHFGADFIKLFPASDLGMGYIKSILAPLSHVPLIATGGVTDKNVQDFLSLGFAGVGVGSNLINHKLIYSGKFDELTQVALEYTRRINNNE